MSKALFGVLIFAAVFIIFIGIALFRVIYRFYSRIKDTKKAMEDAMYNHQRQDYTGRRAQQYHYDDSKKQRRSTGPLNEAAQEAPRRTQTQSGEVIIDHRHQERENKKIFTEDDGEYVDFSEES